VTELIAARDWLTVCQLPPYADGLNPVETVIGHHKTDMGDGQPVLRCKAPARVEQEMWALFAVYQAICKIIGIGGGDRGRPPGHDQIPAYPGRRNGHRRGLSP
jgi:hypothetical protein